MKKLKVALFGGSFNPIHEGHLQIAKALLGKNIVNQVWFIPCRDHAFNKGLVRGKDRARMIKFAIKGTPSIKLNEIELNANRKSYTSQTIAQLREKFPHEFYFVLGADNLADLNKWYNFEYLKKSVEFILVKRVGFKIPKDLGIRVKDILEIKNKTSSGQVRARLEKGLSIKGLVPKNVEEYIKKKRLYL